jgi:uncharacterized membrane protein
MPLPANEYVPQVTPDKRPFLIWSIVTAIALFFVIAILGAPIAKANGYHPLEFVIYGGFSKLCHQMPERSFFIAGHQFAVCARCTGLYFGFAVFALAYPLFRSVRRTDTPARKWLFIAAVPIFVDFGLGYFGIWENTHSSRFLTGALLGAVAVFYVVPGMVQLNVRDLQQLFTKRTAATQQ